MLRILLLILLATCFDSTHANAAQSPEPEDPRVAEMGKLHWLRDQRVELPKSHSTISLPTNNAAVIGTDAGRMVELSGNPSDPNVEAVTVDEHGGLVIFDSITEGFVSTEDWGDIEPKKMLDGIRQNTEAANELRRKNGDAELHVVGWLQQPTLDRQTNTVYWAIEAASGNEHIVNSIALRLGRHGYEELIWVDDKERYSAVGGGLDVMMRAHSFDAGFKYSDHIETDKVAAYGIAGLVGAVVGVKLVKVLAAGGLLLLIKKFGVFLLAIVAAGVTKLKGVFSRQNEQ